MSGRIGRLVRIERPRSPLSSRRPSQVLLVERPVEPEQRPELGHPLRAGRPLGPEDHVHDVAGDQPQHQEHRDRHPEEDRQDR